MTKKRSLPVFLLTDFGTRDSFVGEMKAVIAAIAPNVPIHDITHEIEPFAIDEAKWTLRRIYRYLPLACVVVAVVDPGVGSDRRGIVLKAGGRLFVGPDNGSMSFISLPHGGLHIFSARIIQPGSDYLPAQGSTTFHGRDVFAPVAARLASGQLRYRDVGPKVKWLNTPLTGPRALTPDERGESQRTVIHVDRFGNLVTDLPGWWTCTYIVAGGRRCDGPVVSFEEIPPGDVRWYVDGSGQVALAARQASASSLLGVGLGDAVTVGTR